MYSYTYGGKKGRKFNLKVAEDRIAVRTRNARKLKDAVHSESGKEMLGNFDVEANFPEADVSVLQTKDDVADKENMRDEARSILKKEPELRFAGRVLVDENSQSPVLYTENLFIQFKESVSADRCEEILKKFDLKIKSKPPFAPNAYFVSAPEGTGLDVFALSEQILDMDEVELCHPELVRQRSSKGIHPNQWHLKKTVINGKTIDPDANVEAAHKISKGAGVIIAVIDDGVDIDHPEFNLPGKVVDSRDVTLSSNDPRPKFADEMHGTACAGVACAAGVQVSGVAPEAKLMPIRLASVLGSFAEAEAFYWAAEHGADVISCSWGPADGFWNSPTDPAHDQVFALPDSTRLAIDYVATKGRNGKGCPIFWAAGNGRESVMNDGYASYEKVIAISACNDTSKRSGYSDFGDAVWCCFPSNDFSSVRFQHPEPLTSGIYTADRSGAQGYSMKDYTDSFGGTSSATPGVAGLAALMLSVNPDLTVKEIKENLKAACVKIDTEGGNYNNANGHSQFYGHGRPDAEKAVKLSQKKPALNGAVSIKIAAALVNPKGRSEIGKETVTLVNKGAAAVDLKNWSLKDDKGRTDALEEKMLEPGAELKIKLSMLRLANTGGTIRLLNAAGVEMHKVKYTKEQASKDGKEIEF